MQLGPGPLKSRTKNTLTDYLKCGSEEQFFQSHEQTENKNTYICKQGNERSHKTTNFFFEH